MRQRAIWKLDALVDALGAAPLSDQDLAYLKAQLDKLDPWCDPDQQKREAAYWEDLLPQINAIYAQVDGITIPADLQGYVQQYRPALESAKIQATSLGLKMKAEETYQRLAILLEMCRRGQAALAAGLGGDASIDKVRETVDDAWWELLKSPDKKLIVKGPPAKPDPPQAYQSATFEVQMPNDFLSNTYLMRKKLTYDWTISILSERGTELGPLRVTSYQPRVAQYSPHAGAMKASVKISYQGDAGPEVSAEPIPVARSSVFGIFTKYEAADLIGFGLATAASVASGLTLYALKPVFVGSLQDYLTLFVWGASIDQGKNFLQSLGAYAATTGK